jgi:hypothetical protein
MKTIKFISIRFVPILVLVTLLGLSACSARASLGLPGSEDQIKTADNTPAYEKFTLPGQKKSLLSCQKIGISGQMPDIFLQITGRPM